MTVGAEQAIPTPREQIEGLFDEAKTLSSYYHAVKEGHLAPVVDLERPETDYYARRVGVINVELDTTVRGLQRYGRISIMHEEEIWKDDKFDDWKICFSDVKGLYLELTSGVFQAVLTTDRPNGDNRLGCQPRNLHLPTDPEESQFDSEKMVEIMYEPNPKDIKRLQEEAEQERMNQLRRLMRLERARRLGISRVQ